jgi:hypothetical protein
MQNLIPMQTCNRNCEPHKKEKKSVEWFDCDALKNKIKWHCLSTRQTNTFIASA